MLLMQRMYVPGTCAVKNFFSAVRKPKFIVLGRDSDVESKPERAEYGMTMRC